ncbi:hypothetical protein MJD09_09065 [bacterium]|nr:hypothetical protein [bacterium]
MKESTLLGMDGIANVILGFVLLCTPRELLAWLGLPLPDDLFYTGVLGAVLAGIGIALLLERFRDRLAISGLGLGGAIIINTAGAFAVIGWLVFSDLAIPSHGRVLLWAVAALVLGIGVLEIVCIVNQRRRKVVV